MNDGWVGIFLGGAVIGFGIFLILYLILNPIRIDTAADFKEPSKLYEIQVDDLMFHCRKEPDKPGSALRLYDCKEGYGRIIVIRNFESYSVTRIGN